MRDEYDFSNAERGKFTRQIWPSEQTRPRMKLGVGRLNWAFFLIGMTALWFTTHSGWALFWGWVASLHLNIRRER